MFNALHFDAQTWGDTTPLKYVETFPATHTFALQLMPKIAVQNLFLVGKHAN